MAVLKWLREMPQFPTYPKMPRQLMRDGERLAELSAMPRIFNLLIEDRVRVHMKLGNIG